MSPRWLIALATMFVLLTIMANSIDSATASAVVLGTDDMTILDKLTTFGSVNFVDPFGSSNFFIAIVSDVTAAFGAVGNFLAALWSILWFNYNFLNNGGFLGLVVKYALFWPITIGMLFTLFLVMRQVFSK